RMRAGGDEDIGRGVALAFDLDSVRIDQPRSPFDQGDAGIFEHLAVDALKPIDLLVLGGDQTRPVMHRRRHRPAICLGVGEGVGELRAIDQELLRHAAADDAGAADAALLADADACAVAAGAARRGDAARACADGEHVEIILGHEAPLPDVGSADPTIPAGSGSTEPRQGPHQPVTPPRHRYLTSRNSSMPYFEPSRPSPLSLTPPKGATSVEMMP